MLSPVRLERRNSIEAAPVLSKEESPIGLEEQISLETEKPADSPSLERSPTRSESSIDTISSSDSDHVLAPQPQPRVGFMRRVWNGFLGLIPLRRTRIQEEKREVKEVALEKKQEKETPKESSFKEKFLEKVPAEHKEAISKDEKLLDLAEKRYIHVKSSKNRIYKNFTADQLEAIALNEALKVLRPSKRTAK